MESASHSKMAAEAFRRNANISEADTSNEPDPLIDLQDQFSVAAISEIRNPFARMSALTKAILPLVFKYLRKKDLLQCTLLNRELYSHVNALIWGRIDFDSPSYTSLQMLEKFLQCLPNTRKETLQHIHEIDLKIVEESIYDAVPEDWLTLIVRYCSELRILIVTKARFLSLASIRKLHPYATLPKVHTLDLSYCDHLNEMLLKRIADLFPNLQKLKMSHISGLSDAALSELVYTCHNLSSLDISHARSLSNASLYSVAKFCTIRLRELDLSHNQRISDEGLQILAKYNVHLTNLNLTHISKITDAGINLLLKNTARHLKHLQLHDCKGLKHPMHTIRLIASQCQVMESLSISWDMIKSDVTVFRGFMSPLCHLTIHKIPEHTPIKVLEDLTDFFKGRPLRLITFTRDWYSSDFVWGAYATVKTPGYTEITSSEVTKFNLASDSPIIALLVNERENTNGYDMHNW